MKTYDPRDWYWFVGADRTRVYSSSVGNFVLITNPTYQAWIADGTLPTVIANAQELGEVLAAHSLRPVETSVLDGYLDSQVDDVIIKKMFKIIFNMNNRLRALEGQPPLTVAQARAAFRGLL